MGKNLDKCSYHELQAIASSLRIQAVGTQDILLARLKYYYSLEDLTREQLSVIAKSHGITLRFDSKDDKKIELTRRLFHGVSFIPKNYTKYDPVDADDFSQTSESDFSELEQLRAELAFKTQILTKTQEEKTVYLNECIALKKYVQERDTEIARLDLAIVTAQKEVTKASQIEPNHEACTRALARKHQEFLNVTQDLSQRNLELKQMKIGARQNQDEIKRLTEVCSNFSESSWSDIFSDSSEESSEDLHQILEERDAELGRIKSLQAKTELALSQCQATVFQHEEANKRLSKSVGVLYTERERLGLDLSETRMDLAKAHNELIKLRGEKDSDREDYQRQQQEFAVLKKELAESRKAFEVEKALVGAIEAKVELNSKLTAELLVGKEQSELEKGLMISGLKGIEHKHTENIASLRSYYEVLVQTNTNVFQTEIQSLKDQHLTELGSLRNVIVELKGAKTKLEHQKLQDSVELEDLRPKLNGLDAVFLELEFQRCEVERLTSIVAQHKSLLAQRDLAISDLQQEVLSLEDHD